MGTHSFTIDQYTTSANKDHTRLTGGTLTVDKVYRMQDERPVTLSTYFLRVTESLGQEAVHRGMHSLEHALAYSEQTGSIRSMLQIVSRGSIDGKQLLDCSPFLLDGVLGFRLTSLADMDRDVLQLAVREGLVQAQEYLRSHTPPFSTAKECGQYTFHSSEMACNLIDQAVALGCHIAQLERLVGPAAMQFLYVADLRLIQPRPMNDVAHRTLDPLVSHSLSRYLETALRKSGHVAVLGTFGCMTGMYLLVGGRSDVPSEEYMQHIHTEIAGALLDIESHPSTNPEIASAAQLAIDYIRKYAPGVYSSAVGKA